MGFFSFIKRIGKSIGHGIKKVGKSISSIGKPIVRTVRKAHNFVKNIPVIGEVVKNNPISKTIDGALDVADKGLNVAEKLGDGDYVGAAKDGFNLYNNR